MANLFKVGEKVLNKVMHSSQKEDLRLSEGSTMLYHNYMELGNFMSIITNNVRESVSQTQRLTLLNKDLASSIHQHVAGNLRESFEIQAATEKFNNIHASVVNEHLMDFFNSLELQLIKPLLREKESENDLKKILDERKRLVQDFDSTKKLAQNTYDPDKVQTLEAKLGQLKKRLDSQADQLTDQLSGRNQERAVNIAKSILALMEAQQIFYQSMATLFSDVGPMVAPLLQQLSQYTKPQAPAQTSTNQVPQPKATQPPTQRSASGSAPQQVAPQPLRSQQTPPQQQPKPEPPKQAIPVQAQPSPQPPINMQPAPAAAVQQAPAPTPAPAPAPAQPAQSLNLFDDIPQPTPPSQPKHDTNTLFNLDDDLGAPASQPTSSSSHDFFNTFSSSTTPSQNGGNKNDVFDSFSSFTPVTTKSPQPVPSNDPFGGFFSTTPAPTPTSTPAQQPTAQKSPSTGSPSSPYSKDPGELGFDPTTGAAIKKKAYIAPSRDVLTEMKEREQTEEAEREKRRQLDDAITAKVNQWVSGRKGNLRALLSTLDTILWEDSGWKTVTIGELLPPNKLKIAYRKAQLIVHSDKMIGKSLEHRLLAERVFDMLIDAAKNEEGL